MPMYTPPAAPVAIVQAQAMPVAAAPGIIRIGPGMQNPPAPGVVGAFRPVPIVQSWTLKAGQTINHGLQEWAAQANWTVIWQLPRDWAVPSAASFSGTFEDAATNVLHTLSTEGVLLKADVYEGNHTLVVRSTGERE